MKKQLIALVFTGLVASSVYAAPAQGCKVGTRILGSAKIVSGSVVGVLGVLNGITAFKSGYSFVAHLCGVPDPIVPTLIVTQHATHQSGVVEGQIVPAKTHALNSLKHGGITLASLFGAAMLIKSGVSDWLK